MKKTLFCHLIWLGACTSAAWATPFTGAGSPGVLSVSNVGTLGGGAAAVLGSATATPTLLTLVGSDDPSGVGCNGGTFEVAGPCWTAAIYNRRGVYTFSWDYSTADISPGGDMFGVLVDGVAKLVYGDPGGPVNSSGTATFTAFSSFGWTVNCTDCTGGTATVRISGLNVPEPAPLALVVMAGALAGLVRRRGRSA